MAHDFDLDEVERMLQNPKPPQSNEVVARAELRDDGKSEAVAAPTATADSSEGGGKPRDDGISDGKESRRKSRSLSNSPPRRHRERDGSASQRSQRRDSYSAKRSAERYGERRSSSRGRNDRRRAYPRDDRPRGPPRGRDEGRRHSTSRSRERRGDGSGRFGGSGGRHARRPHPLLGRSHQEPPMELPEDPTGVAKRSDEEERRRRELDEARRDDQTVLVMNLSLKATERDVWKWFSERAGKVRDIQLIRDSRSGKSKGVGYVEFFTADAVIKALALSGQLLENQPIKVQASQAEKNRAAKLAKQQAAEAAEGGPLKLYVGGLVDQLASITEDELRQLFAPFGDVVNVEIPIDPYTSKCRGFAFVQFGKASDAREAMAAMNGFEIAEKTIRVGFATDPGMHGGAFPGAMGILGSSVTSGFAGGANAHLAQQLAASGGVGGMTVLAQQVAAAQAAAALMEDTPDSERLDDEGGGLMSGAATRIALMQKLQRLPPPTAAAAAPVAAPPLQTHTAAPAIPPPQVPATAATVTCNIILKNMFTEEEAVVEGPEFFDDISTDVSSECGKFGKVEKVWVNSKVADGKVYVKFASPTEAAFACQTLHGRFFGGRTVEVEYMADAVWDRICLGA